MALLINELSEYTQGVPWTTAKEYIKYISASLYSSQQPTKVDATNHKTSTIINH